MINVGVDPSAYAPLQQSIFMSRYGYAGLEMEGGKCLRRMSGLRLSQAMSVCD